MAALRAVPRLLPCLRHHLGLSYAPSFRLVLGCVLVPAKRLAPQQWRAAGLWPLQPLISALVEGARVAREPPLQKVSLRAHHHVWEGAHGYGHARGHSTYVAPLLCAFLAM